MAGPVQGMPGWGILRRVLQAALCLPVALPAAAFDSGGSGADGVLAPQQDATIVLPEDGILNYRSITIPAGVKVVFASNRANTPVRLLVSGDVLIAGSLDVSGGNGADVSRSGGGATADDGEPGAGGPGGYAGGRGGLAQLQGPGSAGEAPLRAVAGGAGLGPGGGIGGRQVLVGGSVRYCSSSGGNHASANRRIEAGAGNRCIPPGSGGAIASYGTAGLLPLYGGSGGGGGGGTATSRGAGGGGGGGALLIAASGTVTIEASGSIVANGGWSGGGASGARAGGGGSGGAIRIVASAIAGSGLIEARPGRSRISGSAVLAGGLGRIRLEADNLSYSRRGASYSSSAPGAVFVSNRPRLRIVSVGAAAAPASPSGRQDISLGISTGPVQVAIEAENIPPGTAVSLRVVPDIGQVVEASGSALSGSFASSSSSATATLPEGHSTLTAAASFRVSAADTAMQSRYMRYTGGEAVAMASIDGGAGLLRLLTVSGREVLVPVAQ